MNTQVIKRNGKKEDFNSNKIVTAINKAYIGASKEPNLELAKEIAKKIEKQATEKEFTIAEIQQLVESQLMKNEEEVATAYIIYRNERDRERRLVKTYNEIIEIEDNDVKNENANVNGNTPAGQMMKFASTAANDHVDHHVITKHFVEAQNKGFIHIHDKDYYGSKTTTCVQHDLTQLFKDGFNTDHGFTREPNHLKTAVDLAAISLQTNQNEQHGGQAIVAWDHHMVPYAKKSFTEHFLDSYLDNILNQVDISDLDPEVEADYKKMIADLKIEVERKAGEIELSNEKLKSKFPTIYKIARRRLVKEARQAHEGFIANMNTMHSRGGGQVVFSSVNTGTDTTEEGRIINRALLDALYKGLGKGETSIFPIVIWKVKEQINWSDEDFNKALKDPLKALNGDMKFETPNFDLTIYAMHVAAKRLFPTFMFLDATFNKHEKWDINDPNRFYFEGATMGCRTRVFENLHGEKTAWRRGNLSFTTINLVRLAILAKQAEPENEAARIELYKKMLEEKCELVKDQLLERFEYQCTAKAKQFPFLMSQGLWEGGQNLKPSDEVREVLKQGTLGVGYIGLAEALTMLIGEHHGQSDKAQNLGLEFISLMNDKTTLYKEQYNLNFAVLATPAEGLSGKFTQKDKKEFGIIPGVTDREFYTNSCHVPVYHDITAFEKIKKEAPYHALSLGGHILYIEMDTDAQKNLAAFMMIIKTMKDNNVGYGAVNVPSCRCLKCGYDKPFEDKCPACGEETFISIIKRITGYLVGAVNRWNSAKNAEQKARVKHGIK